MDGHILLCPNPHRDLNLACSRNARDILLGEGCEVKISPLLSEGLEHTFPDDLTLCDMEEGLEGAKLVVTFGGDGTILQAAQILNGREIPLLQTDHTVTELSRAIGTKAAVVTVNDEGFARKLITLYGEIAEKISERVDGE